jgi:outer membrane cobalamin receptor
LQPNWKKRSFYVLILAAIFSLNSVAFAAQSKGRVEGTISDPQSGKVTDASVLLIDMAGISRYQTRTDSEGEFLFDGVTSGRYRLKVETSGFTQADEKWIDVQAGQTEKADVSLQLAAVSDYVVVTATRTATTTEELGGSISVITGEDFRRTSQPVVSESLRLIPGISVAQTAGRGGITSIFTRGGESDYNKVLIDGVPVNSAGGAFDFAFLTPENFDRIEVARGPGSALFGSDAMTSVIQLVTIRGTTETPQLDVSAEGGSYGFNRDVARLSGLYKRFDYSTSFGYLTTNGKEDNNDYINRSASANLGFQLAPTVDLRVSSRFNSNQLGVPGPTSVLFADPDHRQKHKDIALSASLDIRTTSRWNQNVRGIYSELDTFSFDPLVQDLDRPPVPPFFFEPDSAFTFRDHQKRSGIHYQTVAALGSNNILTAGVEYEHESAVFTDDFSRVSPDRNNFGFYVQDQISWRDRLFITAGVRLEHNSGDVPDDLRAALEFLGSNVPDGDVGFGFSANPKIAISAFARPHQQGAFGATRLKASFGTGIKEATLTEAFSPSLFFLGNPGLDPERAISFEVGAAQEFFDRRALVDATYFDNRFRDMIIFTLDPVTFGPVRLPDGTLTNFINLERASGRGIELTGAVRPEARLSLRASYTFLDSQLDRAMESSANQIGLPLIRRPRHSGGFEVMWVDQKFDLTLDGSIVGRRRDVDPVTGSRFDLSGRPLFNDGYEKINAAGSYRLNRFVSFFARVENLFNEDYEEILGFPAYKLNFSAGLRLRLGGGK